VSRIASGIDLDWYFAKLACRAPLADELPRPLPRQRVADGQTGRFSNL
jgi:hypothetical protein